MDDPVAAIAAVLPELEDVGDEDLREGVADAWATAAADNDVDDLRALPWLPPVERDLGVEPGAETLVDHVRTVARGAVALAEAIDRPVDADLLLAGALVHDVSKPYEFDGRASTPVYELLGHPYYGVHVVAAAGLPVELAHVVLSHSHRTAVEPAFLEAALVARADAAAADAIRAEHVDDLRDA